MKLLCIDHGTVRFGLAISDDLGFMAHPLETVPAADALTRIPQVVRERGISRIILGLPCRMDGTEGTAAEKVRQFLTRLQPLLPSGVDVILRDEALTTVTAHEQLRAAGKKQKNTRSIIDQAAAVVILQEYLDEQAGPVIFPPE